MKQIWQSVKVDTVLERIIFFNYTYRHYKIRPPNIIIYMKIGRCEMVLLQLPVTRLTSESNNYYIIFMNVNPYNVDILGELLLLEYHFLGKLSVQ